MISESEIKRLFSEVSSLEEARSLRKKIYDEITDSFKNNLMNSKSVFEKKDLGIQFNSLRSVVDEAYKNIESIYSKRKEEIRQEDLSIPNYKLLDYSFNPLEKVKDDLINVFSLLDFPIKLGEEIVSVEDNFERLNVPDNHPSRSRSETFYVNDSEILRPHCTVSSVKYLFKSENQNQEFKVAVLGPVYRKDNEDFSHIHQFTQLDFLWVKEKATFLELKDFLRSICNCLFGYGGRYRFRNSYFPFTKPSLEVDMWCDCARGCKICRGTHWIEVLGAGMLNRQILDKARYSSKFECIAGGIGLERIALIRYGIEDIRLLYDNNFAFLKSKCRW